MYKEDLVLNNLQSWYAIKPHQSKPTTYIDILKAFDLGHSKAFPGNMYLVRWSCEAS